jgi:SAM-dependent methyltransferase
MNVLAYNPAVYYTGHYWNDYPLVQTALNRRVSGDPQVDWTRYLAHITGGRRFRKALILNCGNGWVERDLLARGLFAEAVGVDYAPALLDVAQRAAHGLPLRYYRLDTNTAQFPEDGYDLVINHAAAHHITYLNRVFAVLAALLPEDGCFAHFDYIGPHRNQYGLREWRAVEQLNANLPPHLRRRLRYPHLLTPGLQDPSEAVHSELIVPLLRRYFTIDVFRPLGGALAYPILTHNEGFHRAPPAEQAQWLDYILAADARHLAAHPETALFAFIVAHPDKHSLADPARLAQWQAEEDARERRARRRLGFYYLPNPRLSLAGLAVSVTDVAARWTKSRLRLAASGQHRGGPGQGAAP